ncbi:hypothetical protein [Streptomyces shenzhenensis]|uniref:hypothetical protein n=1 Tax=Streptomyces shenzhenensis TaxID=943815 RepID=UPI0015F08233|nr:hypothetical protein [Streptomyces shenzhenensis]
MSGRPRDWHPVADSDPIPGDPDQVAALGRQLRKTAEELERQIRNLKAVSRLDAWDSKAGKEFREKAKGNVKKLEAALKRYDSAADALGSRVTEIGGGYQDKLHANYTNYATDLNRAQEIADAALKDAKDADGRKGAAQRSLDVLTGDAKEDKKKLEKQRDAAGGEIATAREKINQAKEIRDRAAKRACDAIDNVISHDSLKDGFWDKFDNWVAGIGKWTGEIATWLGVASLVIGWIPIIGQALAGLLGSLAMILTLVSTLATIIQFARGDAGWMDLGMAVAGFLMMGVGKAFSKMAGRYAQGALARMGKVAGSATSKQYGRSMKQLNKIAGEDLNFSSFKGFGKSLKGRLANFKLERGDVWKSLKEPFVEPFSGGSWRNNLNTLKSAGSYREAWGTMVTRGDGNALLGAGRSYSAADPGIASDLNDIKFGAQNLGDSVALNRIARTATGISIAGAGVSAAGMALDSNLNPLLG